MHLFDSQKFYDEIVPDLKGNGNLLSKYYNSELGNYIFRRKPTFNTKKNIDAIIKFCNQLEDDFKVHPEFFTIEMSQQRNSKYGEFVLKYAQEIDELSKILPLIVFSECGVFNPHLILGRRIFSSNISASENSIAMECLNNIKYGPIGSVYRNVADFGPINWLTKEELELLILDLKNVFVNPNNKGDDAIYAQKYYQDFKKLLQIAHENNLGFISMGNVNESILKLIGKPKLILNIDLSNFKSNSVIVFD